MCLPAPDWLRAKRAMRSSSGRRAAAFSWPACIGQSDEANRLAERGLSFSPAMYSTNSLRVEITQGTRA